MPVESPAQAERLDAETRETVRVRRERQVRDLIVWHEGRDVEQPEGMLLLFERPIQAVAFALEYQRTLAQDEPVAGFRSQARIGIHVGEVAPAEIRGTPASGNTQGTEVEGLALPIARRLVALAQPSQILLSGVAYALAHRAQYELEAMAPNLRWMAHGRYLFKGIPAPMAVHEVGEAGIAPLHAPPGGTRAQREVPLWRRPGALVMELAVLAAVILVPLGISLRAPAVVAFGERDWVVLADLQNHTGDQGLDAALDTAFRISLEQSSFVNVLSRASMLETLMHMDLPRETRVDRAVAAEMALRDGARAMLLPTVSDLGGRIRVSVEVVDPRTQSTVFAQSADGHGVGSVLTSIDAITRDLRASLGETLKRIEESSAPLPDVTTASIEALRLFAAASQHYDDARPLEALALFERAIAIDSDFALAWIGMARCHYRLGQFDQADAAASRSLALHERLPARDALYVEAWRLSFGPPGPSREKWKLLANLYPDLYAAHYNYALFGVMLDQDFEGCVSSTAHLDATQNPNRGEGLYLRAVCLAALGRLDEAAALFEQSVELDAEGHLLNFADTQAARRDYAAAARVHARAQLFGGEAVDLELRRGEIFYAADQGRWEEAENKAREIEARARATSSGLLPHASAWRAALATYRGASAELTASLHELLATQRLNFATDQGAQREQSVHIALVIAYLAARVGDEDIVRQSIDLAGARARENGYPLHRLMLLMVKAEILRAAGAPEKAVAMLASAVGSQHYYYQTQVALMRALRDAHQTRAALEKADWLARHRGRAFNEIAHGSSMMALNVVDANLALLDGAEFALALGDLEGARERRDQLLGVWPTAAQLDWLAPRLAALDEALRGG